MAIEFKERIMNNDILFLGGQYITSYDDFLQVVNMACSQTSNNAIQLRTELCSVVRDGVVVDWLKSQNEILSKQFAAIDFSSMGDSNLFACILNILNINTNQISLPKANDFVQFDSRVFATLFGGKEIYADIDSKICILPPLVETITFNAQIKKHTNDSVYVKVEYYNKQDESYSSENMCIPLFEDAIVKSSIHLNAFYPPRKIILREDATPIVTIMIDDFGLVDMGTSVLWCCRNLEANTIYDSGTRYKWKDFQTELLEYYNTHESYNPLSKIQSDDATYKLTYYFDLPSSDDFRELTSICGSQFCKIVIGGKELAWIENSQTRQSLFFPLEACYWLESFDFMPNNSPSCFYFNHQGYDQSMSRGYTHLLNECLIRPVCHIIKYKEWNDLTEREKELDRLIEGCQIRLDGSDHCLQSVMYKIGANTSDKSFVAQRIRLKLRDQVLANKTRIRNT